MGPLMGPLAGLKVIELAHIMAGPCCGLMLAHLGADVIKLEKAPGGDDTRSFTPPDIGGEAASFLMMNKGKRGMVVDLKTAGGLAVARRLLADADVVIENYRKGTMERLGLGYETLRQANPGLIYCEISGFGRTGPYAERAGFDLVAQGMSGLMSITGEGRAARQSRSARRSPTSPPASWRRSASSPRWSIGKPAAMASGSTPRCSRPASSIPSGSRRSTWRAARSPDRWARPTR